MAGGVNGVHANKDECEAMRKGCTQAHTAPPNADMTECCLFKIRVQASNLIYRGDVKMIF